MSTLPLATPHGLAMDTPTVDSMNCIKCGRRLNERVETVWSKVEGWEKKREQGGTNHVAMRRPLNEYCCNGCMTLMQQGLYPGQQSLV